jgi:hypothetical protein
MENCPRKTFQIWASADAYSLIRWEDERQSSYCAVAVYEV